MPDITVIIPYYNIDIKMLERAVKSVLSSRSESIEIIIIDDGSDDSFQAGLNSILLLDERITLLHQKNKGVSEARNHGIRQARGKYITFLDADDAFTSCCLESAFHIAESKEADLLLGATKSAFDDEKEPWQVGNPRVAVGRNKRLIEKYLLSDPYLFPNGGYLNRGIHALFAKRELAEKILFHPRVKIGEDLIFTFEILRKAQRVCLVDQVWYLYYQIDDSTVHRYNPNIIKDTEPHLLYLRKLVNVQNKMECQAYGDRIFYILKTIHECWLGNRKCTLSKTEKNKILNQMKRQSPWNFLMSHEYSHFAENKARIKTWMFRHNLLFAFWDLSIR